MEACRNPTRASTLASLDSARREFLARGFEGASLQSICADAGVTTGALYKRYKGKADLFEAVVAPTLADIRALEEEAKRRDYALMDDKTFASCGLCPKISIASG